MKKIRIRLPDSCGGGEYELTWTEAEWLREEIWQAMRAHYYAEVWLKHHENTPILSNIQEPKS